MRINIAYKCVNIWALSFLLASTCLNFGVTALDRKSSPDTFPHDTQILELATIEELSQKSITSTAITPKIKATATHATSTAGTSSPSVLKLNGNTYSLFTTSDLGTNPANRVALYQDQFLFAHSTGPFVSLSGANTFQLVRNGQVENYQIVKKTTYCDYSNASQHGAQYSCSNYSEPTLPARAYGDPANYYEAKALGYDFVLMTCAGKSLPGGDATHRLLAYAVRV